MKRILKTLFLIFLTAILSCEEQGLFVNCTDCKTEQPLEASIGIKLDKNIYGSAVVINIYEGNLEDNILYATFSTFSESTSYTVPINKKYAITASYFIHNKNYIAVDSATPRVRYTKDDCDDPCYFVYDKEVNLKLK